jgi:hypothetical protein
MMKTITKIAKIVVGITGGIEIILGVVIWFGVGNSFIPAHIISGIILVVAVWTLAIIAALVGVNLGLVAFTSAWGLLEVFLGLNHAEIFPDQGHWIIQVIHLLVGVAIIALAQRLAILIRQRQKSAINS